MSTYSFTGISVFVLSRGSKKSHDKQKDKAQDMNKALESGHWEEDLHLEPCALILEP